MNQLLMTPPTRTPLSPASAISALWQAHQNVIGGPCPAALLEILAAQSALETGRWKSMWNWNFGNIRGHGPDGAWTSINGASEIIDGKEVFYGLGSDNMFAAYPDAVAGASGLVSFLGVASHPPKPNRYQLAWEAAIAGDVGKYCSELRANGYFTANLDLYAKGVRGTVEWLREGPMREFMNSLQPDTEPPPDAAA